MNDGKLWLPNSQVRVPRLWRPDSRDYKEVASKGAMPSVSYDGFISEMRTEWEDQYTEAERQGPITFKHYLELSLTTLKWRLNVEIPGRVKEGVVTATEAQGSADFVKMLIEYTEREIRRLDR